MKSINEYEDRFTAEIRVWDLRRQIMIYEQTNKNNFDITWWNGEAINSLEKRILMYK